MKTEIFTKEDLDMVATIIKQGGLVAFATDTVYGLASVSSSQAHYQKLQQVKGRPSDKPFPLMVGSSQDIEKIAVLTDRERHLIMMFMPGPVTFILNLKDEAFPYLKTRTVGVRMSTDAWVQELLQKVGQPLWLPSANKSGQATGKNSQMVLEQLSGRIAGVVDGDRGMGVASSVFDLSGDEIKCLREGPISLATILKEDVGNENSISE